MTAGLISEYLLLDFFPSKDTYKLAEVWYWILHQFWFCSYILKELPSYRFVILPLYIYIYIYVYIYCSRWNFGLVRNLIRRIISLNQNDLSYSFRNSFPGSRFWVSCQTQSLWLNNAVQCRRLTGGSSIAAAAWTHEGTYLIYGFLASISLRPRNPSWIWIR